MTIIINIGTFPLNMLIKVFSDPHPTLATYDKRKHGVYFFAKPHFSIKYLKSVLADARGDTAIHVHV